MHMPLLDQVMGSSFEITNTIRKLTCLSVQRDPTGQTQSFKLEVFIGQNFLQKIHSTLVIRVQTTVVVMATTIVVVVPIETNLRT